MKSGQVESRVPSQFSTTLLQWGEHTKTGLPLCPLGGQYPQVFEAAILIHHKEDGSAKIFFWPLLSLQMLKDMLEDIPP